MFALIGQSLLYDVARIIDGAGPISYYQFRSLTSLLEVLAFHDGAFVFVGDECDRTFTEEYGSLTEILESNSDFKFTFVTEENRGEILGVSEVRRFNEICSEIYGYELGITADNLFVKQPKDRLAEDMSEHIEKAFVKKYPDFEHRYTAEQIYALWQANANSSELRYFFRAHLFQAIGEVKFVTPVFENQKLLGAILQKYSRKENRLGSLTYILYTLMNSRYLAEYRSLAGMDPGPLPSLLLSGAMDGARSRMQIIENALDERKRLAEFRKNYDKVEEALNNPNETLEAKMRRRDELHKILELLWMPTLSSLSSNIGSAKAWHATKSFFAKYGIGEVKASVAEKDGAPDATASYSTPSVIGVVAAAVQSIYQEAKDAALFKPSKAVLDLLMRVVKQSDTQTAVERLLPVKDFGYKVHKFIENERFEINREVLK